MRSGVTRQLTSTAGISWPGRHLPNQRIHHLRFDGTSWSSGETIRLVAQLWLPGLSGGPHPTSMPWGRGSTRAVARRSADPAFRRTELVDGLWSPLPPQLEAGSTPFRAVGDRGYAVGFIFNIVNGEEKATAIHFDGRSWSPTSIPGSDHLVLLDVWSKTESGAVAVGDDNTSPTAANGAFLRFDGTTWQPVSGAGNNSLKQFRGTSAADVFAVGDPPRRRRLRPKFPKLP